MYSGRTRQWVLPDLILTIDFVTITKYNTFIELYIVYVNPFTKGVNIEGYRAMIPE